MLHNTVSQCCTCSVNSVWILHFRCAQFLIECTSSVNSVRFLKMHIQCGRLCICAFVWQIFVYMCGRPWHSLSNAHPMCIVYRMLIDLLSGVYFTVFTVKWFHQYKPQLELRQSENKHRIKAHKLREWPIIHRQGVNFQSCGHYWFPEVRLPK